MANYANINNVYTTVEDILNKSQMGFISPQQFNVFAPQAERELFEEIYEKNLAPIIKFRLQNLETLNQDIKHKNLDEISTLFVFNEQQVASSGTNVFDYPARYAYINSVTYNGEVISDIPAEQAAYYINNYYTPPTLDNPMLVKGNNQITVYPTALLDDVYMSYYKNPMGSQNGVGVNLPPSWQYTQVGEDLLYNATTSVDFELPKSVEQKLVYKVLALAGFSIREPEVNQFVNQQEAKDKSTD
tara:strand:+ start:527 stop:1258 length:732 start_codon:yes stop_codon:yes gene_type:complete